MVRNAECWSRPVGYMRKAKRSSRSEHLTHGSAGAWFVRILHLVITNRLEKECRDVLGRGGDINS